MLDLSKQDGFKDLEGPSNAITILNYLSFSFSGLDLSNIKIKNADLDQGMFNETNFKNTEIENTNFSRCILNNSNFEGAKLKNIRLEFGIPKMKLLGHNDQVNSIVFSRDGKYLISGSSDNSIKVWDFEKEKLIRTLGDDSGYKKSVTISKDGKYVVSGC